MSGIKRVEPSHVPVAWGGVAVNLSSAQMDGAEGDGALRSSLAPEQ